MRTTMQGASRQGDRLSRRVVLLAAPALALAWSLPSAAAEDASSFIRRIGDEVVAILGRAGASDKARLDGLVAVLNEATDLRLVGRLVLGKYWGSASESQREEYTELFRALVVKAMADRLSQYGGEIFELAGSHAVDDRDTLVSTRIFRPQAGERPIAVDWRVRAADGRLAIIDIIAEGISLVVTQRSEVAAVVGEKGIDGLLEAMRERLDGRA